MGASRRHAGERLPWQRAPAVARSSYVDPRVIELFEQGRTVADVLTRLPRDPVKAQDRLDRAVVKLLST